MNSNDPIREEIKNRREKAEKFTSDRAAQLAYSGVVIYGVPLYSSEISALKSDVSKAESEFGLSDEDSSFLILLEMLEGHK